MEELIQQPWFPLLFVIAMGLLFVYIVGRPTNKPYEPSDDEVLGRAVKRVIKLLK